MCILTVHSLSTLCSFKHSNIQRPLPGKVLPSVLCLASTHPSRLSISSHRGFSARFFLQVPFSADTSLMTTASCLSVGLHLGSESYTPGIPRTHYNAGTLNAFDIMSASFPSAKHCWEENRGQGQRCGIPLPGFKFPVLSLASCGTPERLLLLLPIP